MKVVSLALRDIGTGKGLPATGYSLSLYSDKSVASSHIFTVDWITDFFIYTINEPVLGFITTDHPSPGDPLKHVSHVCLESNLYEDWIILSHSSPQENVLLSVQLHPKHASPLLLVLLFSEPLSRI